MHPDKNFCCGKVCERKQVLIHISLVKHRSPHIMDRQYLQPSKAPQNFGGSILRKRTLSTLTFACHEGTPDLASHVNYEHASINTQNLGLYKSGTTKRVNSSPLLRSLGWGRTNGTPLDPWMVHLLDMSLSPPLFFLCFLVLFLSLYLMFVVK